MTSPSRPDPARFCGHRGPHGGVCLLWPDGHTKHIEVGDAYATAVTITGQCTEETEFGRCGFRADNHTRHWARTPFGEMWWNSKAAA